MAIRRRSQQFLSYFTPDEGAELDVAVAELEVSRSDLIRQCVLEYLEKRRQGMEMLAAAGEFDVVDG